MTNTDAPPHIEIFKPGTYTSVEGVKMTFTPADMIELAESYDAATNPAPLVIGHPGMSDPAFGWTASLAVAGEALVARTEQVESGFADSVNAGRYKKISAQIYPRDHPANPTPGKLHLKHIGFFGAHPVAVKGLRTASFSETQSEGCVTIEIEHSPPVQSTPKHSPIIEEAILPKDIADKDALSFAETSAALDAREAKIKSNEDAFNERLKIAEKAQADARHAGNMSFAESQVAAGKLMPHAKDELVHVLDQLSAPDVLSFGEADKAKRPADIVRGWFDKAKPVVSFGEFGKDDGMRGVEPPDPVELGERAASYAEEQAKKGIIISAAAAVRHVKKEYV